MKTCNSCTASKKIQEFYYDKRYTDNRYARCKTCCREKARARYKENPGHFKLIQQKYIKANPRKRTDTIMRSQTGLSLLAYEKLSYQQNHRCAVCKLKPVKRRLDIDHCHQTNIIRGLLCNKCNQALGLLQDNPTLITNLLRYLKKCA